MKLVIDLEKRDPNTGETFRQYLERNGADVEDAAACFDRVAYVQARTGARAVAPTITKSEIVLSR